VLALNSKIISSKKVLFLKVSLYFCKAVHSVCLGYTFFIPFNLWTPNVNYSGRTAPLTSKVAFYIFIQQIYVPNILNMVYTLRFFLFKILFVS